MTIETLRPNGTVLNKDVAVTGAASIHAALSDDSDSSYVVFDAIGDAIIVSVDNFTIPAGAIVKQVRGRARCSSSSGSVSAQIYVTDTTGPGKIVAVTAHASSSIGSRQTAWLSWMAGNDQARVNGLALGVDATAISSNSLRVYEGYIDVIYVAKPVVTLDAITDPFTTSSYIPVSWVNTLDSDGGPQERYWVWVTDDNNSDAVVYDSGIVVSPSTSHVVGPLVNGEYTIHVQVAQVVVGVHWSDEDTQTAVTIDVDTAEIGSITATPDNANAKIGLSVAWDDTSETPELIEVDRLDESGWVPVRGATLVAWDGASAFEVDDYEATNGYEHYYRARAYWFDNDLPIVGEWFMTPSPVKWESDDVWLKVPGSPTLNTTVCMRVIPSPTYGREMGVFVPANGGRARVWLGPQQTQSPTGQFIIQTETDAEAEAVMAALAQPVKLLQGPPGWHRWGSRYVATGPVTEAPLAEVVGARMWTLTEPAQWSTSYVEVGRPADPDAGEV